MGLLSAIKEQLKAQRKPKPREERRTAKAEHQAAVNHAVDLRARVIEAAIMRKEKREAKQ